MALERRSEAPPIYQGRGGVPPRRLAAHTLASRRAAGARAWACRRPTIVGCGLSAVRPSYGLHI